MLDLPQVASSFFYYFLLTHGYFLFMDDQEEQQQGQSLIANIVQMIILFWSLGVISWSYFNPNPTRQIDTTFAAGLLSAVTAQYGLNIKKNGDTKKTKSINNNLKKDVIVDNNNNNVGIK